MTSGEIVNNRLGFSVMESPITGMIRHWAAFADAYREGGGVGLIDDGLGKLWYDMGHRLSMLVLGVMIAARIDPSTLDPDTIEDDPRPLVRSMVTMGLVFKNEGYPLPDPETGEAFVP